MSRMSSSKLVRGSHPSFALAFAGLPISWSTSAGRRNAGFRAHVALPVVDAGLVEGDLHAVAHAMCLVRRDDVVLGRVLLEHEVHRLDVVLRVAPVALSVEVAERDLLAQAVLDRGRVPRDLARHEL